MLNVKGRAMARVGHFGACACAIVIVLLQHGVTLAQALPNIVYILADDMGVGDVRSYTANSPVNTPNIDRIANAGMRFTDAHSLDSVCTPSRYGILTGQYAWRTSLQTGVLPPFGPALIPATGRMTVADLLKSSGYSTGMFGKWHEGMNWVTTNGQAAATNGSNVDFSKPFTGGPTDHGFDTFFGVAGSANEGPYAFIRDNHTVGPDLVTPTSPTGQVYGNPSNNTFNAAGPIAPGYDIHDTLPTIVSQATAYIGSKANQANPFFAYIPLTAPHEPIVPPSFAQGQTGLNGNNGSEPAYGDFIWSTDWAVGQILDKLNDPNGDGNTNDSIANNTIVVFAADNGATTLFSFNSSPGSINGVPMKGDKGTVYEGGFRVPFVASWPGHIPAGTVNNHIVELNDLMATAAAITNQTLPSNAGEDSANILPELLGTATTPVRTTNIGHSYAGAMTIRQTDAAGNNWKLIFTSSWGNATPGETNLVVNPNSALTDFTKVQLYNLTTDPGESTNLLSGGGTAPMQQKALQLQGLLQNYMAAGRSQNFPARNIVNGQSTMLIDFGDSSTKTSGAGWNNVSGSEGSHPTGTIGLYDQGGGYTGILMKTSWAAPGSGGVSTLGQYVYNGPYPAAISNLPSSALGDAFFIRDGNKMTLDLSNLDAHATYDFLFYAAGGATGPTYSLFTATGTTSQQAHIAPIVNNSTQVALINGVVPDGLQHISIDFEGRNADGSVGGSGYLNFMRIIEHLLDVPGDFNGDRQVNQADYTTWQSEYGSVGTGLAADGNHDGVVDMGDYTLWRKAMQSNVTPASGSGLEFDVMGVVPEPNACLLAAIGLFSLLASSVRGRRLP